MQKTTYAYFAVGISRPFLRQVMTGGGLPLALQKKLTTPSSATLALRGACVMCGASETVRNTERY